MPLPGGAAGKFGDRFEAHWGVQAMIRILCKYNRICSIQIEPWQIGKAEFLLASNSQVESWQVKRQTSKNVWTLSLLHQEGVLQFLKEQHQSGRRSVFASMSDSPQLRELAERAQTDFPEFKKGLESGKDVKKHFEDFCRYLELSLESESEIAFRILNNTRLEYMYEDTLISTIDCQLESLFSSPAEIVHDALFNFYFEAIHRKVEADDIYDHLKSKGIHSTDQLKVSIRKTIENETQKYFGYQQTKLISDTLIRRKIAEEIKARILTASCSQDIIVKGSAGSGKSGVLFEVLQSLCEYGIPVLAFRMDRLEYTPSTKQLGEQLELDRSPVISLRSAYPENSVVLLIDQLDCMSTTSGRKSEFFETFYQMIEEVHRIRKALPASICFHIIVACRSFDFKNDHRFARLADRPEERDIRSVSSYEIKLLSEEEVNSVLQRVGYNVTLFNSIQIDLLKLPQNLALFTKTPETDACPSFQTSKDIFDRFWKYKKNKVDTQWPTGEYWTKTIRLLCEMMSDRQELSVHEAKLDSIPCVDFLCSEGVILKESNRLGFMHESFFDYCFARCVFEEGRDFIGDLEKDEQHLFRRSQLRQYLTFLRESDFRDYLRSLDKLLQSEKILSHLKYLALAILVSWPDIRVEEWNLLKSYVFCYIENLRNGLVSVSSIEYHAYAHFITSSKLFSLENVCNEILKWLSSKDNLYIDEAIKFLRYQGSEYLQKTAEMVSPYVNCGKIWSDRINSIIQYIDLKANRLWFEIFLKMLENGQYDNEICKGLDRIHSIYGIPASWLIEMTTMRFQRIKMVVKPSSGKYCDSPLKHDRDTDTINVIEAAIAEPSLYIKSIFPLVIQLAKIFSEKSRLVYYKRDSFWHSISFNFEARGWGGMKNYRSNVDGPEMYIVALEQAFEALSKDNPENLREYIEILKQHRLDIANYLLLRIYLRNPEYFADEAISLIEKQPKRFWCGNLGDSMREGISTVAKCSPHCSETIFRKIEKKFLKCFLEDDKRYCENDLHIYSLRAISSLDQNRIKKATAETIMAWQDAINIAYPNERTPERIVHDAVFNDVVPELSDEEWMKLFQDEERQGRVTDGMLREVLSRVFKKSPKRFIELIDTLSEIAPSFLECILVEANTFNLSSEEKYQLACKTMKYRFPDCQRAWLSLVRSLIPFDFDQSFIDYVADIAINATSVSEELWKSEEKYYGGDPIACGMNTPRGAAIWFFYENLKEFPQKYRPIVLNLIDKFASIKSDSIAANVVLLFLELWNESKDIILPLAKSLFEQADEHVLATSASYHLFTVLIWHDHEKFTPEIYRLLDSADADLNKVGGKLAALTRIYHASVSADAILQKALNSSPFCRLGVIEIASDALHEFKYQTWGVETLIPMFCDVDSKVREIAANCFHEIREIEEIPDSINKLIYGFIGSQAFYEHSEQFFRFLLDYRKPLIKQGLDSIDAYLGYLIADKERTSERRYELHYVDRLASRLYATSTGEAQKQALHLIDLMCTYEIIDRRIFEEFDR